MEQLWNELVSFGTNYGLRLVGALALLLIGWRLAGRFERFLRSEHALHHLDTTVKRFLCGGIGVSLKVLVSLTAASILGIPMTSVVALLGTVGLSVGLAMQGALSNIAGSFVIISLHLFRVGDLIEVGGKVGFVDEIGLFYTAIRTPQNERVLLPNSTVSGDTIINYTALGYRRADIDIGIAYDTDVALTRSVLLEAVMQNPLVLQEPAPVVVMTEHADSAVVLQIRACCLPGNYGSVRASILEDAKRVLDENNISIPFPQLDVHLDR